MNIIKSSVLVLLYSTLASASADVPLAGQLLPEGDVKKTAKDEMILIEDLK